MSDRPLVVLKFGSSVLRSESDLPVVAEEIKRNVDAGHSVVAVVSAIGESTESLIARARSLGHETGGGPIGKARGKDAPADSALAALLGTGEAASAALVGLALDRIGVEFTVLDAGRVGPFTRGPQLDAEPCSFDSGTVKRALTDRPVAVLPGFVGRDENGNFSLLGRGGSDLTALFVAHCLKAPRCRLLKDVDGIYETDPSGSIPKPRRYATLDWHEALRLDGGVLQHKAVLFAHRHRISFEVGACGGGRSSLIGKPTSGDLIGKPAAGERRLVS